MMKNVELLSLLSIFLLLFLVSFVAYDDYCTLVCLISGQRIRVYFNNNNDDGTSLNENSNSIKTHEYFGKLTFIWSTTTKSTDDSIDDYCYND